MSDLTSLAQTAPYGVTTVANLLALNTTGLVEGQIIWVDSYNTYSNGNVDGGGGPFMLTNQTPTVGTAGSTTGEVDNFVIFQSTFNTSQFFIRQFTGPYYIEWTGASPTMGSDAGPAINAAIITCPNGSVLTTFTRPSYLITTPIVIKNKQSFTFQTGGNGALGLSGILYYNGPSGGKVVSQVSCDQCQVNGWKIVMNGAARGLYIDTASSGATVTSSQNSYHFLYIINNSNTADAILYSISETSSTNNEFMSFYDCLADNPASMSAVSDTGWYQGNNGGYNTHYHVFQNCTAFGVQTGCLFETGGVVFQGFMDISFCQLAFNGAYSYPVDVNFSDHENCWQITKGSGGWFLQMQNSRIAGCGKSGLGLFDCTSGQSIGLLENVNLDNLTVRTDGGYLYNFAGMVSDNQLVLRTNTYNTIPEASDLNGINLNSQRGDQFQIVAEFDGIFGSASANGYAAYPPSPGYAWSNFALISTGNTGAYAVSGSTLTLGLSGNIIEVAGTGIQTIEFLNGLTGIANPTPFYICKSLGCSFITGGNIAVAKSVSAGLTFVLFLNGTTNLWEVGVMS